MLKAQGKIASEYMALAASLRDHIQVLKTKIDRLSFLRLACFALIIATFVIVFKYAGFEWALGAALLPAIVFVQVIRKQLRLQAEADFQKRLLWVHENELNMLQRLPNGYGDGSGFTNDCHPYLSDLDIFGPASLYELLNRCTGHAASTQLAANLTESRPVAGIQERQEAIAELQKHIKDTYIFRARLRGIDPDMATVISETLRGSLAPVLSFLKNKALRLYTRCCPYLMLALLAFAVFRGGVAWSVFGLAALANFAIILLNMRQINAIHAGFGRGARQLAAFADAMQWIEGRRWQSALLRVQAGPEQAASGAAKRLAAHVQAFDARLNLLVGAFLNITLLWDVRCCYRLNTWLQTDGNFVLAGFDRLAQFEELICFATLAANNPGWAVPVLQGHFCFRATALAHPLIEMEKRVANDFAFATRPTADLVTGSNMAGKSTFLRTLGVNLVLAYAGSVVCAAELETSVFNLFTYMRIRDSLNDRTSTFKAELNRLKMILSGVERDNQTLVLIDEMLRGTNSRDKYLGSKVFLEKLIERQVPVLFATHDLQLAELEAAHEDQVRNFHFDISISQGDMRFDYKLKSGPCSVFNAALLLKEIGLEFTPPPGL